MKNNFQDRICILGAGPAGISAANFLQEKGYKNITVLEKNDYIGGKTKTFFYEKKPYDMAAVEVTPDYKYTLNLIKKFNLTLETMLPVYLIDKNSGKQFPLSQLFKNQSKIKILEQATKYIMEWLSYEQTFKNPGFTEIDESLTQPFTDWLNEKNLEELYNVFLIPVSCYAYGFLDKIPALYILKYMDPGNFATLLYQAGIEEINDILIKLHIPQLTIEWPKRIKDGIQTLMEKYAAQLNQKVILSAKVISVKRTNDKVHVVYKDANGKNHGDNYEKIIVTVPQTSEKLSFMDFSKEEEAIFSNVVFSNSYTYAVEMENPELFKQKGFAEVVLDEKIITPQINDPTQFWRPWEDINSFIFYIAAEKNISHKIIQKKLALNVKAIGGGSITLLDKEPWCYFPHVETDALKAGFYKQLDSLQGSNRTFYAGGLLNFELVENTFAYSDELVNRFF